MIIGVLSFTFIVYVWSKIDVLQIGYELEKLSKQRMSLEQEHNRLQLKLSQLTAPDRIASESEKRLGMKIPNTGQVVLVPVESIQQHK